MSEAVQPVTGLSNHLNEILLETNNLILNNKQNVDEVNFWTYMVQLNIEREDYSDCIKLYMDKMFFKLFYLTRYPKGNTSTVKAKKQCVCCEISNVYVSSMNDMCIDCICDYIVDIEINN